MTAADCTSLDLREELARIDRAREEIRKSSEEIRKFLDEAERLRLEAPKPKWDQLLMPALAIVELIGGIVTVIKFLLS